MYEHDLELAQQEKVLKDNGHIVPVRGRVNA